MIVKTIIITPSTADYLLNLDKYSLLPYPCKTGISVTSALRLQKNSTILSVLFKYVVQCTSDENNVITNTDEVYDKYCSLNFLNTNSMAVLPYNKLQKFIRL